MLFRSLYFRDVVKILLQFPKTNGRQATSHVGSHGFFPLRKRSIKEEAYSFVVSAECVSVSVERIIEFGIAS